MYNFKKRRLFNELLNEKIKRAAYITQAELKGNIQFMSLGTIISVNCNENRTLRLEIKNNGEYSNIYIQDGNIVHADYQHLIGEDAFFKILELREGTFGIFPNDKSPKITITKNWSNLLLEATRRLDESSTDSQEIDWANILNENNDAQKVEKIIDDRLDKMVKALERNNDIHEVAIVSPELKILASNENHNLTEYVEYSHSIVSVGQKLGNLLDVNLLEHTLITNDHNIIVINRGHDSIIISTDKDNTTEILLEQIYSILKRYR